MTNGHRMDMVLNKKSPKPLWFGLSKWRKRWDSNPRYATNVRQFSRLLQSTALALFQISIGVRLY